MFADLGYADAEGRQTKLRLAHADQRRDRAPALAQAAAAEKLGVNQPKVSALANYKLDGFSVERLMTFSPRSTRTWRSSSSASLGRAQPGVSRSWPLDRLRGSR